MKKRFLFIFTLIFVLNTLALSALAAPCPHTQDISLQKAQADLPPCHKKMQEQKSQGHCKGICFCLHAQLSHNVMVPNYQVVPAVFEKQTLSISKDTSVHSLAVAPLLRPPKYFS